MPCSARSLGPVAFGASLFKTLVLGALYNLSDDQIEYQVRDRLSARTVPRAWPAGPAARQWRTIGPVRCPHNTRDENKAIKAGDLPEGWTDKPARRSQKDVDARWSEEDQKTVRGTAFPTSKHGKSHYGYKNHVTVDRTHKLVRRYHVSDAALHDSQAVDHLLMRSNTGCGIWAGRQSCANGSSNIGDAYRSEEMEAKLRDRKLKSHIHRKGKRGKPLSEQGKGSNRTKSTVRVRVEHVFGAQLGDMGGTLVRTIGMVRAKARIGMKNLACNEEGKELIRGINSPTNATPPPVASPEPLPGVIRGVEITP